MSYSTFSTWFTALRHQLISLGQRRLLILNGDLAWSNDLVKQLLAENKDVNCLAYGEQFVADKALVVSNFRHQLGTENALVFFADDNFHADAFAALSGTLVAGGVMIWLCSEHLVNSKNNLFVQRVIERAKQCTDVFIFTPEQTGFPAITVRIIESSEHDKPNAFADCKTQEQAEAVNTIEKVLIGHRNRPLVLTADRGRGKTSALAIAVARRLKATSDNTSLKVLITAPHWDAVKIFFHQLKCSCPEGQLQQQKFVFASHVVTFIAVDRLIIDKPQASLLLVDEAAAIPVYLLSQMVSDYHRVVFSSTVHGYEGAGRGFSLKFKQQLTQQAPEFKQYHIHQPIRWADNDPLEQFIFDSFLLANADAEFGQLPEQTAPLNLDVRLITQQQLFNDEVLLRQIFSVLVTAHYQTKPSDLKLLLNNPELRLFVLFAAKQVIAVAVGLVEGLASNTEIADIDQSKRRLKDQFLPQSLYLHCNQSDAFNFRYLRIMRIAVVEQYQQQGVGSQLLGEIQRYAIEQQFDILGTSFGATAQLLRFWQNNAFKVLRLGFTQDNASGEHSALMLKPISPQGRLLVAQGEQRFYQQLLYLLTEQYQSVHAEVVVEIIRVWPRQYLPKVTELDKQVVAHYAAKQRQFDSCVYSLHLWLVNIIAIQEKNTPALLLAVQRILQKLPSASLCQQHGYSGKKQLAQALISAINELQK